MVDAEGENVKRDINLMGVKVDSVKVSKLYKFKTNMCRDDLKKVAESILTDPISQSYRLIYSQKVKPEVNNCTVIDVWFKPGVTDPVAETVIKAVRDMGFKKQEIEVKTGVRYVISPILSLDDAELISHRILANVNVNDFTIHRS